MEGFHLSLGVSDRTGSSPPEKGRIYSVWMETCKENTDQRREKRGKGYRRD